jgi:hypothetical protein
MAEFNKDILRIQASIEVYNKMLEESENERSLFIQKHPDNFSTEYYKRLIRKQLVIRSSLSSLQALHKTLLFTLEHTPSMC